MPDTITTAPASRPCSVEVGEVASRLAYVVTLTRLATNGLRLEVGELAAPAGFDALERLLAEAERCAEALDAWAARRAPRFRVEEDEAEKALIDLAGMLREQHAKRAM